MPKGRVFAYIVKKDNGGILQGEVVASDKVKASHRLMNQIDHPYSLEAMYDVSVDKAYEHVLRAMGKVTA